MADDVKSFDDLKSTLIKAKTDESKPEGTEAGKPNRDAQGRAYATGKRKDAVARVWIKPGLGRIHGQWEGREDLFRPAGAAHDPAPAADRVQS